MQKQKSFLWEFCPPDGVGLTSLGRHLSQIRHDPECVAFKRMQKLRSPGAEPRDPSADTRKTRWSGRGHRAMRQHRFVSQWRQVERIEPACLFGCRQRNTVSPDVWQPGHSHQDTTLSDSEIDRGRSPFRHVPLCSVLRRHRRKAPLIVAIWTAPLMRIVSRDNCTLWFCRFL